MTSVSQSVTATVRAEAARKKEQIYNQFFALLRGFLAVQLLDKETNAQLKQISLRPRLEHFLRSNLIFPEALINAVRGTQDILLFEIKNVSRHHSERLYIDLQGRLFSSFSALHPKESSFGERPTRTTFDTLLEDGTLEEAIKSLMGQKHSWDY